MMFDVQGVLAPVFTPFLETGQVNFATIPIYMAYLKQQQVNGILVGGTTGEGMALSLEERKLLLEAWITAAEPSDTKVIVQVGGAPLPDVLELAKHAERVKADGIMTLPELYYKPKNVHQLVDYLQRVSEAAPSLPLIFYHFPKMTGVEVNMQQLFTLASTKIPNFKGMKADLAVAEEVSHLMAEDQKIFIANHLIAPSVLMGHESSIATVSNLAGPLLQAIISTVKNGEVQKAEGLQKVLNKIVVAIMSSGGDFVPSMKIAMEFVSGIRMGSTRQPLASLTCEQVKHVEDRLEKINGEIKLLGDNITKLI